jgi:hypothetical protein
MTSTEDLLEDHSRYRRLIKEVVDGLLKWGISDDYRVQMYNSSAQFAKEWPESTARKEMLDQLEQGLLAFKKRFARLDEEPETSMWNRD